MRRTKLYSIVALLAGAFTLRAEAQSGLVDTQAIKPVMMLLVDTSGSMERLPDASGCVDCAPACTNTAADASQKSRWAITLETLTGSFEDFRCAKQDRSTYAKTEFDQGYFLPHYKISSSSQKTDGVLDAYKGRLKFGLMTFDGVMTTVNGDTLVPFTAYSSSSDVRTAIDGRAGMYSYPNVAADADNVGYGWKQVFFPGCVTPYGVNAGARMKGSEPGSLISAGVSDGTTDVATVNESIQSSLLKVRPYGGTPIAAMLEDLRYYLKNDADVAEGGDPFYQCRRRFAVLLTDGKPDDLFRGAPFYCDTGTCSGDGCVCPYPTADEVATKLKQNELEKLWVVAYNVNDAAAINELNEIAREGGTDEAITAQTAPELRVALERLLRFAQPDATSRSVPVVVNTGSAVMLSGKQFEVSAGFVIGEADDQPWTGRLYRRRIGCDGAAVKSFDLEENSGDLFHETLNDQSTRSIWTLNPNLDEVSGTIQRNGPTSPNPLASSTTNVVRPSGTDTFAAFTPSESASTSQSKLRSAALDMTPFSKSDSDVKATFFGDANRNATSGEAADRNLIHDYLHGISSMRTGRKLGDIYHSNPVVLPPLKPGSEQLSTFDPLLRSYYEGLIASTGSYAPAEGRPGAVFVATNDGILHAFNLDTWKSKSGTTYSAGHEFWGFTPPALFSKMDTMVLPMHQFMFDGTPVVRDVILSRSLSSANAVASLSTVLVVGVRGAPAYVALDVKNPESPRFLWQRSFGYLGNTIATPAIAQVKIKWNNDEQIRAVAILPGGEGTIDSSQTGSCAVDQYQRGKASGGRDQVPCWKMRGRSLYVVDIATGELVQEFDARHFPSPMTGAVAVDSEGLSLTRAAYMSDEDGVLWRLSLLSNDPSKWRVAPIHDLYAGKARNFSGAEVSATAAAADAYKAGRPAIYPPLLTRDPSSGNMTIIMGTGDVDSLFDNVAHRVVSLTETRTLDAGEFGPGTIVVNWKLQLDMGESVTGPLSMLDDGVYFTTFTGPSDPKNMCQIGSSRIVGAHVRKTTAAALPLPKLSSSQGGGYVLQERPADVDASGQLLAQQTTKSSLLLGLAIARDPICVVGTVVNDPITGLPGRVQQTGASGGGEFRMRTMVAGNGGTAMPGTVGSAGPNGQKQFSQKMPVPNVARSVGWASSIE